MALQSPPISLVGVTLAIDHVLDQLSTEDIEALSRTSKCLHEYLLGYYLHIRARRHLSPEARRAAMTLACLFEHAETYPEPRGSRSWFSLAENAVVDVINGRNNETVDSALPEKPRLLFDLFRDSDARRLKRNRSSLIKTIVPYVWLYQQQGDKYKRGGDAASRFDVNHIFHSRTYQSVCQEFKKGRTNNRLNPSHGQENTMTTPAPRLFSMMGTTLVMNNILDNCPMEEIEILFHTSKQLHEYISDGYLLRRARRNMSPEGFDAAIMLVLLCQRAERFGSTKSQLLLGAEIKQIRKILQDKEEAQVIANVLGSGRRPLSKTELSRMETGLIRGEILLFLQAVYPDMKRFGRTAFTTIFLRTLHDYEVEEALTALDFLQENPMEMEDPRGYRILYLFDACRALLAQTYYRSYFVEHYKASPGGCIRIGGLRNEVGRDVAQCHINHVKRDVKGPNEAWLAYSRHFPMDLEPMSDGLADTDPDERKILLPPLMLAGPDTTTTCHTVDKYRRYGWTWLDSDTIQALKLNDRSALAEDLRGSHSLHDEVVAFHRLPRRCTETFVKLATS
ncbi:hypothetical protein QBC40DRAFT_298621 [Triangularia verruculosa]|uniref:Uncharacterized protein n=1 Tax=Triangularia verruculosa TaxID=2587418 RepID=A0AAN6XDN9_9PEZI|nr:hypothetical protein QBC40DRAFT_298621 [Triangularia verruculosa]